jgi:hypothetical protein
VNMNLAACRSTISQASIKRQLALILISLVFVDKYTCSDDLCEKPVKPSDLLV